MLARWERRHPRRAGLAERELSETAMPVATHEGIGTPRRRHPTRRQGVSYSRALSPAVEVRSGTTAVHARGQRSLPPVSAPLHGLPTAVSVPLRLHRHRWSIHRPVSRGQTSGYWVVRSTWCSADEGPRHPTWIAAARRFRAGGGLVEEHRSGHAPRCCKRSSMRETRRQVKYDLRAAASVRSRRRPAGELGREPQPPRAQYNRAGRDQVLRPVRFIVDQARRRSWPQPIAPQPDSARRRRGPTPGPAAVGLDGRGDMGSVVDLFIPLSPSTPSGASAGSAGAACRRPLDSR